MGNLERGINGAVYDPVDSDLPDAAECVLRGGEEDEKGKVRRNYERRTSSKT